MQAAEEVSDEVDGDEEAEDERGEGELVEIPHHEDGGKQPCNVFEQLLQPLVRNAPRNRPVAAREQRVCHVEHPGAHRLPVA